MKFAALFLLCVIVLMGFGCEQKEDWQKEEVRILETCEDDGRILYDNGFSQDVPATSDEAFFYDCLERGGQFRAVDLCDRMLPAMTTGCYFADGPYTGPMPDEFCEQQGGEYKEINGDHGKKYYCQLSEQEVCEAFRYFSSGVCVLPWIVN